MSSDKMNKDIQTYHNVIAMEDFKICQLLTQEIDKHLPQAENKIWHAHPFWFLDGHPIVGYGNRVRLLIWSGQSFEEASLKKEGSYKAAEIRQNPFNGTTKI